MNDKCRVCDQDGKFDSLVAKDYFLGTKLEYKYIFCPICNSLSIQDIPKNLPQIYENYYSFSTSSKISKARFLIYKYILKTPNSISKFLCSFLHKQDDLPIKSLRSIIHKDDKILDVGCGSGSLLKLLHQMGFKNCVGLDPFLESDICYPSGLHIKKKEFFDEKGEYDVIMFHHSFEHFSNPKEVLKHVHKLLSKRGICIVRIPDVDSYSFSRYKKNWFSIHAPFHISLPSRVGMAMLAKEAGLFIENMVGEQLIEFFLYSMGHELGVADYEKYGNRKFIEEHGLNEIPPLHIKQEIQGAKQRLRQVKKHNLCDWSIYYLKKESK